VRAALRTGDARSARRAGRGERTAHPADQPRIPRALVPDAPSRSRRAADRTGGTHLRRESGSRFEHRGGVRRARAPQGGRRTDRDRPRTWLPDALRRAAMRSLRASVMVGAALWTLGLLAVWAVVITLYAHALQPIAVIHGYPHTLALVAIAAMVAGFRIVRAGLRPLDEMRRRLAAVQSGAAPQVDGSYPAEVQPLVHDLNALLAHQERAVGRAVAKAGDLAHGLKTPLAVIAQEAERAAGAGQGELAAAIAEQVERMRRQIDYHLAHARAAASGATPGARCAVRDSADGLSRTLLRLHAERGLAIDVRVAPEHVVRCERQDLDEMLGNLVDNAC